MSEHCLVTGCEFAAPHSHALGGGVYPVDPINVRCGPWERDAELARVEQERDFFKAALAPCLICGSTNRDCGDCHNEILSAARRVIEPIDQAVEIHASRTRGTQGAGGGEMTPVAKRKLEIHFGALADGLALQIRDAGISVSLDEMWPFQNDADAISRLSIRGLITDSVKTKLNTALFKSIIKHLEER